MTTITNKTVRVWRKNSRGEIEIIDAFEVPIDDDNSSIRDNAKQSVIDSLVENKDWGTVVFGEQPETKTVARQCISVLAQILAEAKNVVLTVSFKKKDGTERVLTGYHNNVTDSFGRYMFVDLERPEDDSIRLVDPRELNWIQFANGNKMVKG